ncbi:MAG: hydroxymethylbilane synthase [Halofilum sp. (in: g-proteobacteria)]|nr:hydroxymethylbilane synthase [Halofilum sp. (in: g-proteobacteria)]
MSVEHLRIATRKSPLALRQAESVAARLQALQPGLEVELVGMRTHGDRVLDRPLAAIGGKGLFVKELEQGLLDGHADIAVHSMKDVPADTGFPEGLHLPVVLARENPFDAFVSSHYDDPAELPAGAVVGTCSLRRASQLLHQLPGCRVRDLRGNVNTRLGKLDAGEYDAIVLACAGLERLGLGHRVTASLDPALCLPAIGQGVLGIECRSDDAEINACVAALEDRDAADCVRAERAVTRGLGGTCLSPIAGYATVAGARLQLRARVGAADGSELLEESIEGARDDAGSLGAQVAQRLLERGAARLLGH